LLGLHSNFEYHVYSDTVQQTHTISGGVFVIFQNTLLFILLWDSYEDSNGANCNQTYHRLLQKTVKP